MIYATSQHGIDLIKHFEGMVLKAYLCPAKVWTIGYGHTRTAKSGMVITEEQAEALLRSDLVDFERAVNRAVTVPLKQHQFDALVSFAFNVGVGRDRSHLKGPAGFLGSTLLAKVNAEEWQEAALQFGRWTLAGGKVLPGLVRRRKAERAMFEGA